MFQLVNKILFVFVFLVSCSLKTGEKEMVDYDNIYYNEVLKYVELYDTDEDIKLHIDGKNYVIEDSLSKYLSKINIDSLYSDEKFESIMGNLVEKKYLSAIHIIPSKYIMTSLVYNTVSLNRDRTSIQSFLNHLLGIKKGKNNSFEDYAFSKTDFICIDSVILKLDDNVYLRNDSVHKVCLNLVHQQKTGGCLW